MATVFELSEPYRNHLLQVLSPGSGACRTCWTAVEATYPRCYPCNNARVAYGKRLADLVVPIALAVKREQLAHELWHYKYSPDPSVRARLETRLAAVLWRFLGQHEDCIGRACRIQGFDIITTVPGTQPRQDEHPLERIVGTIVGQTKDRFQRLLVPGDNAQVRGRDVRTDRYRPIRALDERPAVLLIDDTWTTGGRAQSAAIALRDAGASMVAVVVIGRHFDRAFGPGDAYYKTAKATGFTWDRCCLELRNGNLQ